jgi:hypothetical protein
MELDEGLHLPERIIEGPVNPFRRGLCDGEAREFKRKFNHLQRLSADGALQVVVKSEERDSDQS